MTSYVSLDLFLFSLSPTTRARERVFSLKNADPMLLFLFSLSLCVCASMTRRERSRPDDRGRHQGEICPRLPVPTPVYLGDGFARIIGRLALYRDELEIPTRRDAKLRIRFGV